MLIGDPTAEAAPVRIATYWLLTYLAHSTILLGAVGLVTRWWVRSHDWRDLLWKTALLGGLVTASLQLALPVEPLIGRMTVGAPPSRVTATDAGRPADRGPATTESTARSPAGPAPEVEALPQRPLSVPSATFAEPGRSWSWPLAVALAWAGVAGLLLLRLVWGRLRLAIRLGERRPVAGVELNQILDRLRVATGVRRRIRLTVTRSVSSPLALGFREICVPEAALTELDRDQQEAMLAHELAHLARFDPLLFMLAGLVERLLFFQPLNRVARRRLQEAAEYRADDWAVRRTGAGLDLAKCLAKVAEWMEGAPAAAPIAGMAEDRSHLVARVRRLIEEGAMTSHSSTRFLLPSAAAILGITVLVVPGFGPGAGAAPAGRTAVQDTVRPPRKSGAKPELGRVADSFGKQPVVSSRAGIEPALPGRADRQTPDTGGVVPALMAAIRDPDVEVRRAVVRGLGNHRDRRAGPALLTALRDADAEVRVGAIEALSELEYAEGAAAIGAALADESVEVRRAAAEALANLETPGAVPPLIKALDDPDAEVRAHAADGLGNLNDKQAVPALMKALGGRSAEVRHEAAEALGNLEDPRAAPALAQALSDADSDVRRSAIEALGNLDLETLPTPVIAALRDANADVRRSAAQAVGNHREAQAVPVLRALLEDPAPEVREAAVEALGEIRTSDAIDALVMALKSKDPTVRKAAAEALGQR